MENEEEKDEDAVAAAAAKKPKTEYLGKLQYELKYDFTTQGP